MNGKKLYKSRNKKLCGVCGGVAEYFGIDPTIVRLIWVLVALTTGIGVIGYIVAALVIEEDPAGYQAGYNTYPEANYTETSFNEAADAAQTTESGEVKGFKP
jgi:phage shock protein PspC (stress-responsive transcriptional regulator)